MSMKQQIYEKVKKGEMNKEDIKKLSEHVMFYQNGGCPLCGDCCCELSTVIALKPGKYKQIECPEFDLIYNTFTNVAKS